MADKLEELAKQMKGSPDEPAPAAQDKSSDVDLWGSGGDTNGGGSASGGLTEIRPNQSDTLPHALEDTFSNIGAGGLGTLATLGRISPWGAVADHLQGKPTIYEDAYQAVTHPKETGEGLVNGLKDMAQHPLENIAGGIGAAGAGAMIPVGEGTLAKIPSKARAGEMFRTVEQAAANTPVAPVNAWPEVERFKELVKAGGKGSRPVTQLAKRLEGIVRNPQDGSFNFPEARDYYSNISDASHASTLSKVMGTAPKPVMLRQLGALRKAFDEDLTNTAGKVGHADTYANAMDEYARAARLRKALIAGGGMAAGAALGGTLPGKVLSKFVPTH